MARMTVYTPQPLIDLLAKITDIDYIAPKILDAGIDPLEKQIKANASKYSETGAMISSIKRKKAKKGKDGSWSQRVQFEGYDKSRKPTLSDPRGIPNARKAMSHEYGTSKQPAIPIIRPAVISTESQCIDSMQEAFNQEVSKP
jgi:HK97 gp10 family phage protein